MMVLLTSVYYLLTNSCPSWSELHTHPGAVKSWAIIRASAFFLRFPITTAVKEFQAIATAALTALVSVRSSLTRLPFRCILSGRTTNHCATYNHLLWLGHRYRGLWHRRVLLSRLKRARRCIPCICCICSCSEVICRPLSSS